MFHWNTYLIEKVKLNEPRFEDMELFGIYSYFLDFVCKLTIPANKLVQWNKIIRNKLFDC